MRLYHVCPVGLDPGSVIRPGNYGRIIKLIGDGHPHWYRENQLEAMRLAEFPDKPSRLHSCFGCESLEAVRFFRQTQIPTGLVYLVEPTNPSASKHIADFNCVQPVPGKMDDMEVVARHYWSSSFWYTIEEHPGLRCAETVISSGLRILEEVDGE